MIKGEKVMKMLTRSNAAPKQKDDVRCGDYYHADRRLYRVEHAQGDRVTRLLHRLGDRLSSHLRIGGTGARAVAERRGVQA
jgi:hypothetical protein